MPRKLLLVNENKGPKKISKLSFSILGGHDIVSAGELQIINRELYEIGSRNPKANGVLDKRMGVSRPDSDNVCSTCMKRLSECPGHFGYIQLNLPCFHIGYFKHCINILHCICKTCSRVLLNPVDKITHLNRVRTTDSHWSVDSRAKKDAWNWVVEKCKRIHSCPYCGAMNGVVKKMSGQKTLRVVHEVYKKGKTKLQKTRSEFLKTFETAMSRNKDLEHHVDKLEHEDLTPLKVHSLFKSIQDCDLELLYLSDKSRPEWMLFTNVPVPPACIRPSVVDRSTGASNEDDLSTMLAEVVHINESLAISMRKGGALKMLAEQWDHMQLELAQYINSDLPGLPPGMKTNYKPIYGLCQRLKGKQGRFRGNLSGKRVDFSARTVISPDPNLKITEVGVPQLIAQGMTYPEKVNRYNIHRLREAVLNGIKWPGANFIRKKTGENLMLKYGNPKYHAKALQIGDVVERHLINGDIVLFNRQPSLHKVSIMAHEVHVVQGRTFRFNECCCTPYNADFDGDEMNLHVPQTEEARTEAKLLMGVVHNICTPKDGSTMISATQDFITSVFLMTQKNIFMTRDQLCKTVVAAGDGRDDIVVPPPAICYPVHLWTGKQAFSMMLKPNKDIKSIVNLQMKERNYQARRSCPETEHPCMCPREGYVWFLNSELVCGNLGKSCLAGRGLFYSLLREHGETSAAWAMNRLTKMCTRWLSAHGFTIGIDDVIPPARLMKDKKELIENAYKSCDEKINLYKMGNLDLQPGCSMEESLESEMNGILARVRDKVGQICMEELPWSNAPRIMSSCGAKGSTSNICQMVAAVGQQQVNGARAPDGFIDRSLPHFGVKEKGPKAKGFVANSFYSGLTAQEFFFHTMAGREGLVDTAVKTAETGYMSRRLMKALEDLSIQYDRTVRNSQGSVIAFDYGDDGLNPVFMEASSKPVHFERILSAVLDTTFIDGNTATSKNNSNGSKRRRKGRENIVPAIKKIITGDELLYICKTKLLPLIEANQLHELETVSELKEEEEQKGSDSSKSSNSSSGSTKTINYSTAKGSKIKICDMVSQTFIYDLWTFCKTIAKKLKNIVDLDKDSRILNITELQIREFLDVCFTRYQEAKIEPGEAVGAIGAQSLGEPGTQMTLKTFHFAGVASMNVTLGVPRIKELINASKNISTPLIMAKLRNDKDERVARIVKGRVEKSRLGDVAEYIQEEWWADDHRICVKLDLKAINELSLDLDIYSIIEALEADSKLKLTKRFEIDYPKPSNRDTIVIRPKIEKFKANKYAVATSYNQWNNESNGTTTSRRGKDSLGPPVTFAMSNLKESLKNVIISGIVTVSRAVVNIVDAGESIPSHHRGYVRNPDDVYQEIIEFENMEDEVEEEKSSEGQKSYNLIVEGSNLLAVMGIPGVDGNKTRSNDVMEVAKVLGIEAARVLLQIEIAYVYDRYGLNIDSRHLGLLSDTMTYRGEVLGITREGISKMKDSVLMLASFEKTPDHLFDAAVHGKVDAIDGVSERIIMGTPIGLGTGSFKLLKNIDKQKKNGKNETEKKKKREPLLKRLLREDHRRYLS